MESASTINAWVEELASSILPPPTLKSRPRRRRSLDGFRKRLRHHNFNRTNQFDVNNRLSGLEEKFQVLNRDDLSDALYKRRTELREHHERWIPDILDLLLRLSDDPANETELSDLTSALPSLELPALLKWEDIEAGNPIDRTDPIWQAPEFSDLSSDEEDLGVATTTTSPASVKPKQQASSQSDYTQHVQLFENPDFESIRTDVQSLALSNRPPSKITEIQLARELLLVAQGYPSNLLKIHQQRVLLDHRIQLNHLSKHALQSLVTQIQPVQHDLDIIQKWICLNHSVHYIQTIKQSVEIHVQHYMSSICALEESTLHPELTQTISLISILTQVEQLSRPISILARWVGEVQAGDSIAHLDTLYVIVSEYYFSGDIDGLSIVVPIFIRAFDAYMQAPRKWLETGILPTQDSFFVQSKEGRSSTSRIWHDWFELRLHGSHRPPTFLQSLAGDIFTCGKTVAFINQLRVDRELQSEEGILSTLHDQLQALTTDENIPFLAAFADILQNSLSSYLISKTILLKHLLETRCGMSRTLDALEYVYLRKQGVLLDKVESRVFYRIDQCMDNWNDRFLIADILEDVFDSVDHIDVESIVINSVHTSSRSMGSRRRSVRILEALAIEYVLPQPVTNIISKTSLAAYGRIALHLIQLRRAKYVLDRMAYIQAHNHPISNNTKDQKLAQTTTFMLIQFANTLYDHFTTGVVLPLTIKMRKDLETARTVDTMIAIHETYIANLEFACLTSKPLKMLRETLIGLLDMCIRFADLVSTPAHAARGHRRGSDDLETGSFRSARSQRNKPTSRSRRGDVDDSSEGDDDEHDEGDFAGDGEGYSSFVVLDEDTSVVQEIRKLQVQFKRQLDFFVAGLRGVARGGGTVEEFEILAGRLDWKSQP